LEYAKSNTDPFCRWILDKGAFYGRAQSRERPLDDGAWTEQTIETPRGPLSCVMNTSPATQWVRKPYIRDDEDIRRFLSIPYEAVRPDTAAAWDLQQRVGETGLMYTEVLDGIGTVESLFTLEEFTVHCLTSKDTIVAMVKKVAEQLYDYVHHLLHHGPPSLYCIAGPEMACAPILRPQYFDELVTPFDGPLIELIHEHGSWALVHCHGRLGGVLERIADLGAEAVHPCEAPPSGDVPLSEVKRRVGDRLCIVGNVQIADIIHGTRQDIEERVREAVRDGARGGGLILSTSASPYEEELAPQTFENYVQFVESGRRHSANTKH
jgi:hypothetical protein